MEGSNRFFVFIEGIQLCTLCNGYDDRMVGMLLGREEFRSRVNVCYECRAALGNRLNCELPPPPPALILGHL